MIEIYQWATNGLNNYQIILCFFILLSAITLWMKYTYDIMNKLAVFIGNCIVGLCTHVFNFLRSK